MDSNRHAEPLSSAIRPAVCRLKPLLLLSWLRLWFAYEVDAWPVSFGTGVSSFKFFK
jgi:hypothetical protein